MLKKSEIFAKVLSVVSEVTEVPQEDILSRNRSEEVVDARCLLVSFLHDYGFYPSQIAKMIGRTPRQICIILNKLDSRKSHGGGYVRNPLELYQSAIAKQLKNMVEASD